MTAFYNEIDPYAAQWLRNLIAAGHIAPGIVDERPIQQIEPWELAEFTQCHFFAGIGVWSHALRRAGWSDDRPVWTGSCPCQPFSAAGQQKGFDDERHLWPTWFNLIQECKPAIVLGEQVASALDWLDLVSTDLEAAGYAFGASDLCAAGFGGAHIRQRLYFVGLGDPMPAGRSEGRTGAGSGPLAGAISTGGLADTNGSGQQGQSRGSEAQEQRIAERGGTGGLADASPKLDNRSRNTRPGRRIEYSDSDIGNTAAPMLGRNPADWLYCRDGKWRPVEPGTFPLADAAPARVGRLRAYGNGLDAETATQFVSAVREIADLRSVREFDL